MCTDQSANQRIRACAAEWPYRDSATDNRSVYGNTQSSHSKNNPNDLTGALIRYRYIYRTVLYRTKMIHCHALACLSLKSMENKEDVKFSNKIYAWEYGKSKKMEWGNSLAVQCLGFQSPWERSVWVGKTEVTSSGK